MFGVRLTTLFTSRWMALGWAILICLTAVQFVAGRSGGAGPDQIDPQDEATARDVNAAVAALN